MPQDYAQGSIECLPGMDQEGSLETRIQQRLSEIRSQAGDACVRNLHHLNATRVMEQAGSKGSAINIAQMVACVGQQVVSGSRIPEGFVDRSLPHFTIKAKEPKARGFVANSFYSGLEPEEFFFHTMCGREGLVDTAVKTAETGYMQRRLMKAMEDFTVMYDGSTRNSSGDLVQFTYGDDGLDPADLDDQNTGVHFKSLLRWARARYPCSGEKPIDAKKFDSVVESVLTEVVPRQKDRDETKWVRQVREFLHAEGAAIQGLGIPSLHKDERVLMERKHSYRRTQLKNFLLAAQRRLERAAIEPGTACGALTAQSIGEPGTQMTLKTFHFAGVASMNVTMGVPRIKEIINAAKTVSTPIITVVLESEQSVTAARVVKGRIEKTRLSQIVEYIEEVYQPGMGYLLVRLSWPTIHALALEVTAEDVQKAIIACPKLPKLIKLSAKNVVMEGPDEAS